MSDNTTTAEVVGAGQRSRARGERGMTTAEYAVGTVGAVTAAGTLLALFSQPWFQDLLQAIIRAIIVLVTGLDL